MIGDMQTSQMQKHLKEVGDRIGDMIGLDRIGEMGLGRWDWGGPLDVS